MTHVPTITTRRLLAICGLISMATLACDHPKSNVKAELPKRKEGEKAPSVSLPAPPPASGFVIPEKHDDGTMRIRGMIHHKKKYLDKPVTVKGTIQFISEKCDPKKAKKKNKKCPEPHLSITDADKLNLLVVGYKDDFIKKAKIKVGESYDFKGTYQLMAMGFTATEDGLLLLDEVNGKSVIEKK